MAEPIGLASSLIAIFDLCVKVTIYIQTAKGTKNEKSQLASEIGSLQVLIGGLHDEPDEGWKQTLTKLTEPGGPLEDLKKILDSLETKLTPATGRKHWREVLLWPFEKKDVDEYVQRIERRKSALSLMLNNNTRLQLQRNVAIQLEENSKSFEQVMALLRSDHEKIDVVARNSERSRALEILQWVTMLTFGARHETILKPFDREMQTGAWVLSHTEFVKWKEHSSSTKIWCHGIPGAGKSVIAAIISDHLRDSLVSSKPNVSVATLYCDHGDQSKQRLDELLRSIFRQVLADLHAIPKALYDLYAKKKEIPPSFDELCSILQNETKGRDLIVILDALDEADDDVQDEIVGRILGLPFANIKLLCTSRPLAKFESIFQDWNRIQISASCEDIETFVTKQIATLRKTRWRFLDTAKYADLDREVVTSIQEVSGASFLMATQHMKLLRAVATGKELKKALTKLPSQTTEFYSWLMKRILSGNHGERATTILSIVFGARQHLGTVELQHALAAVELEKGRDGAFESLDEEDVTSVDVIIDCCEGLLILEGNSIRTSHSTANEYFLTSYDIWFPNGQTVLATSCFKYMSQEKWWHGTFQLPQPDMRSGSKTLWNDSPLQLRYRYPFLYYSGSYWGIHVWEAYRQNPTSFTMQDFKEIERHWLDTSTREFVCKDIVQQVTTASRTLGKLLQEADVVDNTTCQDVLCRVVLEESDKDGTTFILDLPGMEVDSSHPTFDILVEGAIQLGWEGVVQRLLSPDRPKCGTPRLLPEKLKCFQKIALEACFESNDREGIFEFIFAMTKDVDPEKGHDCLLDLLDRHPAKYPDQPYYDHRAGPRYPQLLMFLWDNNLDMKSTDPHGNGLLHQAAQIGSQTAIQCFLVDDRCNADAQNSEEKSACQVAIDNDHIDVALHLLPRMSAASKGSLQFPRSPPRRPIYEALDIVLSASELQSYGGAKDGKGRTALSWLVSDTSLNVSTALRAVKFLLRHGADIDSQDGSGRTPLSHASTYAASSRGGYDVVEDLVRKEAKVNLRDNLGRAPIHYVALAPKDAGVGEPSKTTRLFQQSQADLQVNDYNGVSALGHLINAEGFAASDSNRMAQILFRAGVDPNATGKDKEGPLLVIVRRWDPEYEYEHSHSDVERLFWSFLDNVSLDAKGWEDLRHAVSDAGNDEFKVMVRVKEWIESERVFEVDHVGKTPRDWIDDSAIPNPLRGDIMECVRLRGGTPRAHLTAVMKWQIAETRKTSHDPQ